MHRGVLGSHGFEKKGYDNSLMTKVAKVAKVDENSQNDHTFCSQHLLESTMN